MGNRSEPAAKGDAQIIIERMVWLSDQALQLSGDIDLAPGPSFGFYQDRWSSDDLVRIMSKAEKGMHIDLICVAWQQQPFCSLPDDEVLLRAWCGHPNPEEWTHHQAVLFSSKDGSVRRSWVYHEGRWWQVGLCRTLLEQVSRRLRRQKASHARYSKAEKSDRATRDKHHALEMQCTRILDALQALPVPVPGPIPSPVPVPVDESPIGDAPPATEKSKAVEFSQDVRRVWQGLVDARSVACEVTGQRASKISLTPKRAAHLAELIATYGVDQLLGAFAALVRSDYHLGRGRHQTAGPRLTFEAITSTDGKLNQIEVLSQLAEQPDRSGPSEKPFAPSYDPEGEDDDGHEIE